MPLSGMTGFARLEGQGHGARWAWEARSVNGKGLDVKTRLPTGCESLEPLVREGGAARFARGSIQVSLNLKLEEASNRVNVLDRAFLEAIIEAGQPYISQGKVAAPSWDGLLALRGAFLPQDVQDDVLSPALLTSIGNDAVSVLDALRTARRGEGSTLQLVLGGIVDRMDALTAAAEVDAAAAPAALRERLAQKLVGLVEASVVDTHRLAQEVALLATRADVREELDRLHAHIADARRLLVTEGPVGRKIEFLVQELNREANTLCSKASEISLTRIGLDLKSAIDQFREQSSNVE